MTVLTDTQVITASGGLVELGYVERRTDATSTATTLATASNLFSTNLTFVADGSPVMVEFFSPRWINSATSFGLISLVNGSGTEIGLLTLLAGSSQEDTSPKYRYTPTAGVQTLNVKMVSYDGTLVTLSAGGGGPGVIVPIFLRVSKIVQATQWPAVITGSIICTSSTRPASPFVGQQIYETDTRRSWTYITAAWVPDDDIYATEAARDAAIPSPFEGQRAYITGSTETTAAGLSTQIPTGIQTIHNGAGWVTVTPVGGTNTNAGTTVSPTMTTVINGLTGATPAATLRTGTTALVSLSSRVTPPSTASIGYVDVIVSGASSITPTVGASRIWVQNNTGYNIAASGTFIITGLTAGVNIFTFAVGAQGGTLSIYGPAITVQGIA